MTESNRPRTSKTASRSRWRLFVAVLTIGAAGIFYHMLVRNSLNHSAALYIGLPFLLALGLSLTPKSQTTMGATMKGLTIALLLSAPVFMEGFLCIVLASPILYSVAALVAYLINRSKSNASKGKRIQASAFTFFFALFALEGTHPGLTFERSAHTQYSKVIQSDIKNIRHQLSQPIAPFSARPVFLKLFPAPDSVSGQGLAPGDTRDVQFTYHKWFITNTHTGTTRFTVEESSNTYLRFAIPHDDSYISHYLDWKSSEIWLEPLGTDRTRVTWKLSYDRKLDPAWYFGPMQKYAVWLAAKVLVDHVATPDT